MHKTSAMIVLAAMVVVYECGIILKRNQLGDHPQCIWVWYPKYPRNFSRRPMSTIAPTLSGITIAGADGDGVSEVVTVGADVTTEDVEETTVTDAVTTVTVEGTAADVASVESN